MVVKLCACVLMLWVLLYKQENELAEVYKSKQETVNDLTSQLCEQTTLGELLCLCEPTVCTMARVDHSESYSADDVRNIEQ